MSQKKQIFIVFMTVFIDLVGFGIIIPLSPYLAREFGGDAFQVGLLMAIYSFFQFLFAPVWGGLSDKYGRRPIILLSLFGAGISHLIFAFGSALWILFVARALAGLFGANISTAMAYMADITEEKDRSKGMGLIGAAFGLGFVLGPTIGSGMAEVGNMISTAPPFGDSFAAVFASLICLANFVFAYFALPESLKLEEGQAQYHQKKRRLLLLKSYLPRPITGRLMIAFFLLTLGMAHMEASLFLFVQDKFSWSLISAGLGFAYVGLIMVFTQGYLIRKLLPKYGEKKLMLIGLFFVGFGLAGIGFADEIWALALVVTFLSLGVGMANPSLTGSISLSAGKQDQGSVLGANQSLSALARIIGPALGGWFYREISIASPFFISGLFAFMALVLVVVKLDSLPSKGQVQDV
ncbi:MAG: MFS transporter [Bdellovibrionales bacterium]|nr:MFS transporter [Bdellovibrionales bacterium]